MDERCDEEPPGTTPLNAVRLRGRLGNDATERVLPSGARILTFRLVVARESTAMTRGSRQKSDWVECTAWTGGLRRTMGSWRAGDVVEVEGALRRRHFRSAGGGATVVDIEALAGRRLQRVTGSARARIS